MIGSVLAARAKTGLQSCNLRAYTFSVAETTATEIGVSELLTADNRHPAVFFRPLPCVRLQWSGLGRGALAHAGFRKRRYANPVMRPATLIGVRGWVLNPAYGGCTMRQALARSEQMQNPTEFANRALRDAALAPTVFEALDICADALQALASFVQPEDVRRV